MDYRLIRKRIWWRRIVVIIIAGLIGAGASYYSIKVLQIDQSKIAKPALISQSPSNDEDDWNQILEDLDNLRAQAIMRKDKSLLEEIYSEHCQLRTLDSKLIQSLISNNLAIFGLDFKTTSVELLSHRWSNNEEVVELRVTDNRSKYTIRSIFEKQTITEQKITEQTIAERGEETWLVSLQKVGQKWLIANAQPALDDR